MQPLIHKKTQTDFVSGILLVNKPVGLTSHDVVRAIVDQQQVGHAGTLDPLASGLLVLCLGKATKVSKYLAGHQKTYRAKIRLGLSSSTYDREGLDASAVAVDVSGITSARIEAVLATFRGTIEQRVPLYSAVHVEGERLHTRARRGQKTEIPKRDVTISALSVVNYDSPHLTLDLTCSKGTYIRSLAHDIGQTLGCGAYLHELCRTAAGDLTLNDALTLETIESRWRSQRLGDDLLSINDALHLPAVVVDEEGQEVVVHGRDFKADYSVGTKGTFSSGDTIVIENRRGKVLAIGTALADSGSLGSGTARKVLKYERVLI